MSEPALDLAKFDADRLRITDAAVAVLEVVPGLHLTGQFALGKNGTLVYVPGGERQARNFVCVDRKETTNHFQPSRRFTTAQNSRPLRRAFSAITAESIGHTLAQIRSPETTENLKVLGVGLRSFQPCRRSSRLGTEPAGSAS